MTDPPPDSFAATMLRALEGKDLTCAYDLFNRGNAYAELGRHDDAIADYDRANQVEPDYEGGMAWFNRGNSLLALGRRDEALASYRRPVEIGSIEWGPYGNVGALLGQDGRHDEALAIYDAYLAMCAREGIELDELGNAIVAAHVFRAGALARLGREDEAEQAIATALELDPSATTEQSVGDHYGPHLRRWARALPHYQASYAEEQDELICTRLGLTLANLGRRDEALAMLREAVAHDPATVEVYARASWRALLDDPSILDELGAAPPPAPPSPPSPDEA